MMRKSIHFFSLAFVLGCLLAPFARANNRPADADTYTYTLTTSNITFKTATLGWTGSGAASFDIRWRKQGDPAWTTTSEILANSFLLTDLEAGQPYEWQLLPANSTTWLGGPTTFTTTYGCPAPSINSVASVSATSAGISWFYSSYPDTYTVDYQQTGATSWSSITGLPPETYTYKLTGLTPATAYNWRVRSNCSIYSEVRSFTTLSCSVGPTQAATESTLARLSWPGVQGAKFTLRWRPQGDADWRAVDNLTDTYFTVKYLLTGLTPNAVYEYQVQPVCGTVVGLSTPVRAFTAACTAPTSVSYTTLTNKQISLTWKSNYADVWNDVGGYGFEVEYRTASSPVGSWSASAGYSSKSYVPAYDFYHQLSGLSLATPYEMRVRTTCPNSNSSAFSNPSFAFTTAGCTNQVTTLYQTSPSSFTAATLRWATNSYDNYYVPEYRLSGAASWTQTTFSFSTGSTSYTLQNLTPGTAYEWRVLTYCSPALAAATPSVSQTFTMPVCTTNRVYVVATSPNFTSARLTWGESSPAAGKYVMRYRVSGVDSYTTTGVLTATTTLIVGLTPNTAYEWQVAPVCDASATSFSFTTPQPFTTACFQTASNPSVSSLWATSALVGWTNAGDYGDTFTVRYKPQGGDWLMQTSTTNQASFTGLQTNTMYTWEVAHQCAAGVSSTYTAGNSFTTTCANGLYDFRASYITTTKANLQFSDTQYRYPYPIRYRPVNTSTWTTINGSAYGTDLSGLLPNTTYEWQAATQCNSDFVSDFSATQTFTTGCLVPTYLYASESSTSASLYWNNNSSIPSYTLQYRLQGNTDWQSVTAYQCCYYLSNIAGTYEWRVRANCDGTYSSDYSSIKSFTTTCYQPTTPTVSNLSSYGALVSWQPQLIGSARYNLQWRATGAATWNTISDLPLQPYMLTGLTDNAAYEVRVQAQCGTVGSVFTPATSFGSVCSAPTNLSSVASNYFAEPGRQFYWKAVPGVSYTLRWRNLTTAGQPVAEWSVLTNLTSSGTYLFQMLPGPYEWQVQSVCVNGSKSAFVGGPPFLVQACQPNQPSKEATEVGHTRATLTFGFGATTEVRWRKMGAVAWQVVSNLRYPPVSLTGLTENTAYEWQARILCDENPTLPFGTLQSFTTTCGQPTDLKVNCLQPDRATLRWQGNYSSTYEVNWRMAGVSSWNTATINTTSLELANLATGTTYEWRIRPACSASSSSLFSDIHIFQTQCGAPYGLKLIKNDFCTYGVSWEPSCYNGLGYTVRVSTGNGYVYYTTSSNYVNLGSLTSTSAYVEVQANCSAGQSSNWVGASFDNIVCTAAISVANLSQSVYTSSAWLSWQTNCGTLDLR